jgi:IS5 family transposase
VLAAIEGDSAAALDVDAAARLLRARADARDESFFAARGFDGTRAFYDRYLRLSAVLVFAEAAAGDARAAHWSNRSARHPLPDPAARACLLSLRAG